MSKFIADDDEVKTYTIIKKGKKPRTIVDDEEDEDAETAEDDFLRWAEEQDALDNRAREKKRTDARNRALGAIASSGVDITSSPDDGPPLIERSDAYLEAYARARVDGYNPDQPRAENGQFGEGSGTPSTESKAEKPAFKQPPKGSERAAVNSVARDAILEQDYEKASALLKEEGINVSPKNLRLEQEAVSKITELIDNDASVHKLARAAEHLERGLREGRIHPSDNEDFRDAIEDVTDTIHDLDEEEDYTELVDDLMQYIPEDDSEVRSDSTRQDRIEKRGDKYLVLSMGGDVLGEHDSPEDAKAQLAVIERRKRTDETEEEFMAWIAEMEELDRKREDAFDPDQERGEDGKWTSGGGGGSGSKAPKETAPKSSHTTPAGKEHRDKAKAAVLKARELREKVKAAPNDSKLAAELKSAEKEAKRARASARKAEGGKKSGDKEAIAKGQEYDKETLHKGGKSGKKDFTVAHAKGSQAFEASRKVKDLEKEKLVSSETKAEAHAKAALAHAAAAKEYEGKSITSKQTHEQLAKEHASKAYGLDPLGNKAVEEKATTSPSYGSPGHIADLEKKLAEAHPSKKAMYQATLDKVKAEAKDKKTVANISPKEKAEERAAMYLEAANGNKSIAMEAAAAAGDKAALEHINPAPKQSSITPSTKPGHMSEAGYKKSLDTSGTQQFRKQVDDYEHSGDTDGEADELEKLGVIVTGTKNGNDEGEPYGAVEFKLPKGVNKFQFNELYDLSMDAQGYHAHGAEKEHKEVVQHFNEAKSHFKNGQGAKVEASLMKAKAAVAARDAKKKGKKDSRDRDLGVIASTGVDITASPDRDDPTPLMERSDAYIRAFAMARVDGYNPDQPRDEAGRFGEGGGGGKTTNAGVSEPYGSGGRETIKSAKGKLKATGKATRVNKRGDVVKPMTVELPDGDLEGDDFVKDFTGKIQEKFKDPQAKVTDTGEEAWHVESQGVEYVAQVGSDDADLTFRPVVAQETVDRLAKAVATKDPAEIVRVGRGVLDEMRSQKAELHGMMDADKDRERQNVFEDAFYSLRDVPDADQDVVDGLSDYTDANGYGEDDLYEDD